MAQPFAVTFYASERWRHCRRSYLDSVGGLCEHCLVRGIYTPAKIVHHLILLTPENINDPCVTMNFENLEALCQDCHAAEHKRGKKRYFVSADGTIITR